MKTKADPLERRLAQYGDRDMPASLEEVELSLSTRERVIIPMYRGLARFTVQFTPENQIENIRHQIELAGKSQTMEPVMFFGQRIALTLALGDRRVCLVFLLCELGCRERRARHGWRRAFSVTICPCFSFSSADQPPPGWYHQGAAGRARPADDLRRGRAGL